MKSISLIKLSFPVSEHLADDILDFLANQNLNPVLEEKPRQKPQIHLYCKTRQEALIIQKKIFKQPEYQSLLFRLEKLPFDRWATRWKKGLTIIKISDRLVIRPHWIRYQKKPLEKVVVIDPEMAFGTGHHPTTRICLEWISTHASSWKSIIDVGCGSGILSISAIKLGVPNATALDIDAEAVEAAEKNAQINRADRKITFLSSGLGQIKMKDRFDGVLANLTARDIQNLWPQIAPLAHAKTGIIILSGIEKSQTWFEPWLVKQKGWKISETKNNSGWLGYLLKRKNRRKLSMIHK